MTAMLTKLLRAIFPEPFVASIEAWDRSIREYQVQSSDSIAVSIKASVLSSEIENQGVREHIQLNAARLVSYDDILAEVVRISHAQRSWESVDRRPGEQPKPMEVDALGKGKGNGKGKGDKGKGQCKGEN